MTEIIESNRLIELVAEKHRLKLGAFEKEFSELDSRFNSIKQQMETLKKEKEAMESRIMVLNEKYHLLFHQAKKQREELFNQVIERMRAGKANMQPVMRIVAGIGELEKRIQVSNNITDEENIAAEIKKLLHDFESEVQKVGIAVACNMIADKLDEAISSHKELISVNNVPVQQAESVKDSDKQMDEIEKRHIWLKHRIESHRDALAYWEKQKGGIQVA